MPKATGGSVHEKSGDKVRVIGEGLRGKHNGTCWFRKLPARLKERMWCIVLGKRADHRRQEGKGLKCLGPWG